LRQRLPGLLVFADLKRREKEPAARRLIMNLIDLCDFVIDSDGGYVEDEEGQDTDEYYEGIVVLVQRLLQRFEAWVDPTQLPRVADAARRAVSQFAEASARLTV
jgi:hypothetical protein